MFFFVLANLGALGVAMTGFVYPFFFCYAGPNACALCPIGILEQGAIGMGGADPWHSVWIMVYTAGLLGLLFTVFGRSFCGWACPVGFIQDLLGGTRRDLKDRKMLLGTMALVGAALVTVTWKKPSLLPGNWWFLAYSGIFMLALGVTGLLMTSGIEKRIRTWERGLGGPKDRKRWVMAGAVLLTIGLGLYYAMAKAQGYGLTRYGIPGAALACVGLFLTVGYALKPRHVKYAVLILIPITSFISGAMLFTDFDPIGMITATIPALMSRKESWNYGDFFYVKTVLTAMFAVGVVLSARFWCRTLCPVGAGMAPFNKISILTVETDLDTCIHCNRCSRACDMNARVPNFDRDPECTLCGDCIDVCPEGSRHFSVFGRPVRTKRGEEQ